MIHPMELIPSIGEKLRGVELFLCVCAGSTGESLGLVRSRDCCDNCTTHLLKCGQEGASTALATSNFFLFFNSQLLI